MSTTTGQTSPVLHIAAQPDDITCGPTCLQAVYQWHGQEHNLDLLIKRIRTLPDGGTLAVHLGRDALAEGFHARIHSWNLRLLDPSWFDHHGRPNRDIAERLQRQAEVKPDLADRCAAYVEFLAAGGEVRFGDLTGTLIRRYLSRKQPIITGLSATYLYRTAREIGSTNEYDDLLGEPSGHFVVLADYTPGKRLLQVHDPLAGNPVSDGQQYKVPLERVIAAVMLGTLTHDANMLIVTPPRR